MSRRKNQLFNLSFLDLITGALGAVIFLFIITPKGGSSAPDASQVVMYLDTAEMKIFGDLDDSLRLKRVGDTLFTVLVDYKNWPKQEEREERAIVYQPTPEPVLKTVEKEKPDKRDPLSEPEPVKEEKPLITGPQETPVFKGDAPAVPCKVSFEISWASQVDNVDFFVCRDNTCVYGGNRRDRSIGDWDSGKSRNRLFANDLRTTQEAVRQFDQIIPGEYRLYAQFKTSERENKSVKVTGLIYTKNPSNEQRGESFTSIISLGKSRTLLGKVVLRADGTYDFTKR